MNFNQIFEEVKKYIDRIEKLTQLVLEEVLITLEKINKLEERMKKDESGTNSNDARN